MCGHTARGKKMDITKLVEELYSMMESKQSAVCSIEFKELRRTAPWESYHNIQSANLEDTIPILFQADIDQWTVTDISTEVYMMQDFPSCSNYFIHIKLMRFL